MRTVLLHGFLGNAGFWRPLQLRVDAPREIRNALALDLLGHGQADDGSCSFEEELARVARRLQESGDPPWHVVGYSLGGRLALGLLARYRNLVGAVTTIGAHPGLEDEVARCERRASDELWAQRLEEDYTGFLDAWEAQPFFALETKLPRHLLQERRIQRLAHQPARLARALRVLSLGSMPSWWPEVDSLDRPRASTSGWPGPTATDATSAGPSHGITLPGDTASGDSELMVPRLDFVAGESDTKFVALGAEVVHRFRGARLLIAPGVGHNVVFESVGWFADCLASASAE